MAAIGSAGTVETEFPSLLALADAAAEREAAIRQEAEEREIEARQSYRSACEAEVSKYFNNIFRVAVSADVATLLDNSSSVISFNHKGELRGSGIFSVNDLMVARTNEDVVDKGYRYHILYLQCADAPSELDEIEAHTIVMGSSAESLKTELLDLLASRGDRQRNFHYAELMACITENHQLPLGLKLGED